MKKTIRQSELNRLGQQLEDLRQALAPFAAFYDPEEDETLADDQAVCFRAKRAAAPFVHLHVVDFRRAYVLLARLKTEDLEVAIGVAEDRMARFSCASTPDGAHFPRLNPGEDHVTCSVCQRALPWVDLDDND